MNRIRLRFGLIVCAAVVFGLTLGACSGAAPQTAQKNTPAATPAATATAATPATEGTPVEFADSDLDVPYVPTPQSIVDKMLQMAKVRGSDLLYDLGSGDGRIVVTAAKRYGARGVGYDINPQRIKESNDNARAAGVTDKVKFIRGDLFEADLSGATVVTLYLLPDINLKLRPKLLKELKPGTRIVSHNYGMGDWEPLEVFEMEVNGTKHYIYSWIVPEEGKGQK